MVAVTATLGAFVGTLLDVTRSDLGALLLGLSEGTVGLFLGPKSSLRAPPLKGALPIR